MIDAVGGQMQLRVCTGGSPRDFAFSVIGEILWRENLKFDFQMRTCVQNNLGVSRENTK